MIQDLFKTISLIKSEIKPVAECELVGIENACGRVLSEQITARKDLPAFDNSALDGYAFAYADKDSPLSVKGVIFAGDKKDYEVRKNECYKIMTGAKMPRNADTILRVEDAEFAGEKLLVNASVRANDGHRVKGEELKVGAKMLENGRLLRPADIMALASQGICKVRVVRKLRVGVFSSGNELVETWENADENSIYNANAPAINALLKNKLCEVSYLGIIKDDLVATKRALENANYDLLITSGGASVGDADFMDEALSALGFEALFTGITIRPAKPTKLYKRGERLVFILPGNPISAFLSCFLVGKALIGLLSGAGFEFEFINAEFQGHLKIKNERNNLILGTLKDGKFTPSTATGLMKPFYSTHLLISEFSKSEFTDGEKIKVLKI